jgi:mannosyltransferase
LLYPSLYEGFGIPPLEAMSAGCPFIAMKTSSIPEVAGQAGILVDTSDAEMLSQAIESCALPENRTLLRDRGFLQAAKFSWQRVIEETHAIYRALDPQCLS